MIKTIEYKTYIYVYSDEDLVITDWDKVDVMEYKGDKKIYLPLGTDITKYYEITEEEHFDLISKQQPQEDIIEE